MKEYISANISAVYTTDANGVPTAGDIVDHLGVSLLTGQAVEAPQVIGTIADRVYTQGAAAVTIDLTTKFSGGMSYDITPKPTGVSISGATVTINPTTTMAQTTLTASATNAGGTATVAFDLTVNAVAPTLTAPLSDVSLTVGDPNTVIDLTAHFANAATYQLAPTGQGVSISGTNLTVSGAAERTGTYTVTARNSTGQEVADSFDVTVAAAQVAPTLSGGSLTFVDGDLILTPPTTSGNPDPGPAVLDSLTRGGSDVTGELTANTIEGAPGGDYESSYSASNGVDPDATVTFTLTVEALTVSMSPDPATAGEAFTLTFSASPDTVSASVGGNAVTLSGSGLTRTGTAAADGTMTVTATKAGYVSLSDSFTVDPAAQAPITLTAKEYPTGQGVITYDVSNQFTGTVTGWAVSGNAAATIDGSGVLSIDTDQLTAGTVNLTVTATGADNPTGSLALTMADITVTFAGGVASVSVPDDTPDALSLSVTATGGDYDGEAITFTKGDLNGLGVGEGLNVIDPDAPVISTDGGTADEVDSGDVLTRGRAGLWLYTGSAPTITASLRDQTGELVADFEANDYTATGSEGTSLFTRETDGTTDADSATVPVIAGIDLSQYYGTAEGDILQDMRLSERSVNSANTITAVPSYGGAPIGITPYNINGTPLPTGGDRGVTFFGEYDALALDTAFDLRNSHTIIMFNKMSTVSEGFLFGTLTAAVRLGITGSQHYLRIDGGGTGYQQSSPFTIPAGWNRIEMRVAGGRLKFWLNDTIVHDVAYAPGSVISCQYIGWRNQAASSNLQMNATLGDVIRISANSATTEYPALTDARAHLDALYSEPTGTEAQLDLAKMFTPTAATQALIDGVSETKAPYPAWQAQQAWTPPADWFANLSFTATADDGYLTFSNPYKADGTHVHPKVLYFQQPWNGWRYVMGINPYEPASWENPVLFGSNDLKYFTQLDWTAMPMAAPTREYLSDITLTYDPTTAEIIVVWRDYSEAAGAIIRERRTRDGFTWTAAETIFDAGTNSAGLAACPSFIYNADESRWWMFVTVTEDAPIQAWKSPTRKSGTWTPVTLTGAPNQWHVDVMPVGTRLMAVGGHRLDSKGNLKIAYTTGTDWTQWTTRTADAMDVSALNTKYGVSEVIPYKSSIVPRVLNNGTIETMLVWTCLTSLNGSRWRVFTTKSAPYTLPT